MMEPNTKLKTLFNSHMSNRSTLNDQFEDYAGWTLPYLYLPDGADQDTEAQHDYQSVGAQAVNHLANKIASTLFPPGRPFFRMDLNEEQIKQLADEGIQKAEADVLLTKVEKEAMKLMSRSHLRTAVLTAIKHLIVFGNALLYMPASAIDKRNVQVYNLRDYVVQRDVSGKVVCLITRDNHQVSTLPQNVRELIATQDAWANKDPMANVELYTIAKRIHDGRFRVWQELEHGIEVPGSRGLMTEEDLPWITLTWNLQRGANYGNGLVEEYAGDFHTLSSLSEALLVLSGIVSDIKILVDPMGSTDVNSLNDSESGTFVNGNADDISFLQLEKFQDMRFLREQMNDYERRIGAGFLFNSAVTRDAERVTAEEIRMQANELEGSFGGVYSRLGEEMQLPIAERLLTRLDDGLTQVEPIIITGIESLSRTSDLDNMMMFFNDLAMLANLPPEASERLNFAVVITKLGSARSVDYDEMLLDEDTVNANREQRLAQEQQAAAAGRPAQPTPPQPV